MLPLIDTHQHLVYRNEISYSWTKDIPPLAVEDFTINNYRKLELNREFIMYMCETNNYYTIFSFS